MPITIGTVGHGGHGKTTLLQALRAMEPIPSTSPILYVDAPGIVAMEIVILCISATAVDFGKDYLQSLPLLPIRQMLIALTKTDLVNEEVISLSIERIKFLSSGTRFENAPIVAVGQGLGPLREALAEALETTTARRPSSESPHLTTSFDAEMQVAKFIKHGQTVRVFYGRRESVGKGFPSDQDPRRWHFRFTEPIAIAVGQPILVRRYSPPDLFGGGVVVRPAPARPKKSNRIGDDELGDAVLKALHGQANGVTTEAICRQTGRSAQELGTLFEGIRASGVVLGFAGLWIMPNEFEEGAKRFLATLLALQVQNPSKAFIPPDQALLRSNLTWSGKPLDRILAFLETQGRLELLDGAVRHPDFQVILTPSQREFLDRVKEELNKELISAPSAPEIARFLGAPVQAVKGVLEVGRQANELVVVGEGLFLTMEQVDGIREQLKQVTKGQPFSAADARDLLGTSRKYIIPVLEYLDEVNITERVGDQRVLRR